MKQDHGPDVEARSDQILKRLRAWNFRVTPQRLAVLRVLAASERNPFVEMVYERVRTDSPTTSLAAIYRTVSLLKEMEEVLELGFADGNNPM